MIKNVKGTEVPAIGLGTWQMKGEKCVQAVKNALNMGYRHIDTAQFYDNEKAVGQGVQNSDVNSEDIFITTKVWRDKLHRESVLSSTEKSLERLNMDYVDLLLIHWPNENVPLEETLRAMKELKERGKVRNIGVSNFTEDLMEEALELAPEIITNQVEMHVLHQQKEMQRYCVENNLLLTAYSPLAKGKVANMEDLQKIGEEYGKSPAQIALRWLIQQDNVIAIPKAIPKKYQRENLEVIDFKLREEDMEKIFRLNRDQRLTDPGVAPW